MKIGFFGGSFDPIHLGHINLALRIMELKGLDRILFSLAALSPSKKKHPPVAAVNHRLNMLQLALEDVPNCDPYTEEIHRLPLSYTIDAIRILKKKNKDEIFLITAEDAAYGFGVWKEIEELLTIASPLIGVRYGFDREKLNELPEKIKVKVKEGMCPIPAMDISSTEIRERLKKKLYCGHLVQGKVLDYIHQNTIYYL